MLANEAMAKKLASLLKLNPDTLVSQSDLDQREQLVELAQLALENDLGRLGERLETLGEVMKGLEIKSIQAPSNVDVATLMALISDPESFKGERGKDGNNGKDGKHGTHGKDGHSITGQRGDDGRDGRKGERGETGFHGLAGKDGQRGETGKGSIGHAGEKGEQGIQGATGKDGSSIIGAYFNGHGELVLQIDQEQPDIPVGMIPAHHHTQDELDFSLPELTTYEAAKTALIAKVGTGYTLPAIDRAVYKAKLQEIQGVDLVIEFAESLLNKNKNK